MSLVLRAKTTSIFGLGRQFTSGRVAAGSTFTVPEAKVTQAALASVRTLIAAGKLEVVSCLPSHGLNVVRNIASRNQLHITLGLDHGPGMLIPNGSTVHKLTLGGVPFLLGDANVDGDTTALQLAAFVAALNASAAFAATGAVVRVSQSLALPASAPGTNTLTSNNTNVVDGDTVVIGTITYRFKDTPVAAYDVQIGANADASLLNLIKAINASGVAGTNYFAGTLVHPKVSAATSVTSHAFAITSKFNGGAANLIATTETSGNLSWTTATLTGGLDNQALVLIDGAGVQDWAAFEAATSLTDTSDEALATPYVGLTFFDATTHDTVNSDSIVYASRTVTAADVTRGYIAFDTGITNLATTFAARITRAGVQVLHDGTQSVLGTQSLLLQNDGSVDYQAGDVVQIFAAGAD